MKLLRMGMPEPRYVVEPLGKHHQKSGFSCGQEALETYLLRQASQDVKRRLAQVFVMRPLNHHRVDFRRTVFENRRAGSSGDALGHLQVFDGHRYTVEWA